MSLVIGLLGLALAYVGAMLAFQRRLLFPRPPVAHAPARPEDANQVWLTTPAGQVEAWYLPPVGEAAARAPTIVFFHGNGELIDVLPPDFEEPRRWGVGVLLVEFPGYGSLGWKPVAGDGHGCRSRRV